MTKATKKKQCNGGFWDAMLKEVNACGYERELGLQLRNCFSFLWTIWLVQGGLFFCVLVRMIIPGPLKGVNLRHVNFSCHKATKCQQTDKHPKGYLIVMGC